MARGEFSLRESRAVTVKITMETWVRVGEEGRQEVVVLLVVSKRLGRRRDEIVMTTGTFPATRFQEWRHQTRIKRNVKKKLYFSVGILSMMLSDASNNLSLLTAKPPLSEERTLTGCYCPEGLQPVSRLQCSRSILDQNSALSNPQTQINREIESSNCCI